MTNHATTSIEVILQTAADIDLEMQRLYLIAHIRFCNTSSAPVQLSHILLKLSPSAFVDVSGKVVAPQFAQVYGLHKSRKGKQQTGWRFDREDWFSYGHRSGEYQIESMEPLLLQPSVWNDVKDIHIACDIDRLVEPLQVHAFVIADGQRFPAANPTSISFRSTTME